MKNSDSRNTSGNAVRIWSSPSLKQQGVKHVFGIPGAKIDRVFDSLLDSSIT